MANVLSVSSPQGADRTETARGVPGCGTGCRLHDGRPDRVQPPDDLMRFVEPSHKHIARREDAVSHREARCQLERRQQVRRRVVKPAGEEVGSPLLNSQRSLPPPASVRRRASSNSSRPTSAAKTKARRISGRYFTEASDEPGIEFVGGPVRDCESALAVIYERSEIGQRQLRDYEHLRTLFILACSTVWRDVNGWFLELPSRHGEIRPRERNIWGLRWGQIVKREGDFLAPRDRPRARG
jgi:hypothetical protein